MAKKKKELKKTPKKRNKSKVELKVEPIVAKEVTKKVEQPIEKPKKESKPIVICKHCDYPMKLIHEAWNKKVYVCTNNECLRKLKVM